MLVRIIAISLLSANVAADIFWQPYSQAEPGHHAHKKSKSLQLSNLPNEIPVDIKLVHSDLEISTPSLSNDVLKLQPTRKGNYHALVATLETPDSYQQAVRYPYMNGKPVDFSPSDLLAYSTGPLRIVPSPLPREHWRYETDKTYLFKVTFNNKPYKEQPILVSTSNGSTDVLQTDSSGLLKLHIPDDFTNVVPGKRKNPAAEIRLFANTRTDSIRYTTSFSAPYSPNPSHWKSTPLGALAAAFGLMAGLFVIRRLPEHSRRPKK